MQGTCFQSRSRETKNLDDYLSDEAIQLVKGCRSDRRSRAGAMIVAYLATRSNSPIVSLYITLQYGVLEEQDFVNA